MVMPSAQYRISMGTPSSSRIEWAWTESLAMARPGSSYRIARIPFTLARERCEKWGCGEGEVVTCARNGGGMLVIERANGEKVVLERTLAWFIQAEICSVGGPSPH